MPVLAAGVDALARARRRRAPVGPWLLWIALGIVPFLVGYGAAVLLSLVGATPDPPPAPVAPGLYPLDGAALVVLAVVALAVAATWGLLRHFAGPTARHLDDAPGSGAGVAVALALGAAGLALLAIDPFAALLAAPALHLWMLAALIDPPPARDGDRVTGTGLDNSLGVLAALLAAAALSAGEGALRRAGRRLLVAFTDQEEGPPDGFFGHGAARLAGALPPPIAGCVVVDAHTAGPGPGVELGRGAGHGTASGWGRGSIAPPNVHALALDLARQINDTRPGTVQMNTGYLSRSDDMILGRWAPVLGLIGPPMTDPHTGHEAARLSDIQASAWWLAHFLAAALNIAPEIGQRYGLAR